MNFSFQRIPRVHTSPLWWPALPTRMAQPLPPRNLEGLNSDYPGPQVTWRHTFYPVHSVGLDTFVMVQTHRDSVTLHFQALATTEMCIFIIIVVVIFNGLHSIPFHSLPRSVALFGSYSMKGFPDWLLSLKMHLHFLHVLLTALLTLFLYLSLEQSPWSNSKRLTALNAQTHCAGLAPGIPSLYLCVWATAAHGWISECHVRLAIRI